MILLSFRLGTIAITADIKLGFLQILVDKKELELSGVFCVSMMFSVMILILLCID